MVKTNKKCIVDLGKNRIERRIWVDDNKVEYIKVNRHWHKLETFCVQAVEEDLEDN